MSKRKRPEPKSSTSGINSDEKNILGLIRTKQGMGATTYEMKVGTNIQPTLITRVIASLKKANLIKEVPNMNNKGIKHYLAVEFEPSKDLTGGDWYIDGTLDITKIETIKKVCVKILESGSNKVITLDVIHTYLDKVMEQEKLSREQTKEILNNLVLDNVVMELTERFGQVCYKLTGKKSGGGEARAGEFALVPCGALFTYRALYTRWGYLPDNMCLLPEMVRLLVKMLQ